VEPLLREGRSPSDHAHTYLCTSYGRNIQNALRKAHAQIGFQYVRFHGIFNDDMKSTRRTRRARPSTTGRRSDVAYDAIIAAGMRPMVEVSFTPPRWRPTRARFRACSGTTASPRTSARPPAGGDWSKWQALMTAFVRHLQDRYGADEVRNNWYFEVWNEPSWMYSLGDDGYFELYKNTVTGLLAADPGLRVGGPAGLGGRVAGADPEADRRRAQHRNEAGLPHLPPLRRRQRAAARRTRTDAIAFHKTLVDTVNATVDPGDDVLRAS
jgi:beta-xylosidase